MTTAAAACAVLAVLSAGAVLARTGRPGTALPVLLDLLLAAGLLQLAGDPGWTTVGVAAAVVALRGLTVAGLRAPSRSC